MIEFTRPEVAFAIDAVQQANRLSQRVQTGLAVQGITKSDLSPVTVADFAVQALVAASLDESLPGAILVGEERAAQLLENPEMLELVTQFVGKHRNGASADAVCAWIDRGAAEPTEHFWTVDPIDGTKGYLRGGQYAIALGLIEAGKVSLGVLGCPNLGDHCLPDMGMGTVVVAQRGQGTWYSVAGGPFTQIRVSSQGDVTQARLMRSVESGHTNTGQIGQLVEHLGIVADPVCMDSQAKYAVLAAGGGEMLFRLLSEGKPNYREKIWDQAAGSIVLEEAGGRVTDLAGRDLDFSQGRSLEKNRGIFASNGLLHTVGLEALDAIGAVAE
jgi:3'(2'), 5'-bisphosphate nucleotidase